MYAGQATSDPFTDRQVPLPIKKPPSLFLKNSRPPSGKTTPTSGRPSPSRRPSNPSPFHPKLNLTSKQGSPSIRSKLKGPSPFRTEDMFRRRAETAPVSPYRSTAAATASKPKKKVSVPRAPSGLGE